MNFNVLQRICLILCTLRVACHAANIGKRSVDEVSHGPVDDIHSDSEHDMESKDDPEDAHDTRHDEHDDDDGEDDDHHAAVHWSYSLGPYDPVHWAAAFPVCNSSNLRQSPIDVQTAETRFDESLDPITFVNDVDDNNNNNNITITVINNGHSVNVVFPSIIRVMGGKLRVSYRVAGAHFHWGETDDEGSEHSIDGKHFPFEMHVVTYDDERFSNILEASQGDNGLAVIGVLFEISEKDNPLLAPLVTVLNNISYAGESVKLPVFKLRNLTPRNLNNYYRYFGSLTTPPCSETVIWTALDEKQTISPSQLAKFRTLHPETTDEHLLTFNWRSTQPLQQRVVTRSFLTDSEKQTGSATIITHSLSLQLAVLVPFLARIIVL